jgi:ABC-type antimicrobial peptide transport system permease subunit
MPLPLKYNFRSMLLRKSRFLLTAGGIALSVFVALAMIALAQGITKSLRSTGHPLNVLVTAKGAETIEFSALDRSTAELLKSSPFLSFSDGAALASPELYFSSTHEASGKTAQAVVRGVLPIALQVHEQVRIVDGRFPGAPGEIMVGPLAATRLGLEKAELAIGKTLVLDGSPWSIVGRFEAPGTAFEAEIWGPLDDLMATLRKEELNLVVLRAKDSAAFEELLFDLDTRTDVLVSSRRETDYFAAYADAFLPISEIVTAMAVILTLGGTLIGMNTLFAAVTGRTREIGMLRTLGFRRWHIAFGFAIEGIFPSLAGSLLACLAALALNGFALKIPMGAFRLNVDPPLLATGLLMGLVIGLLGSLLGITRAVRLRTIEAIRHL